MKGFNLTGNRVLVKPGQKESKTESELFIPDSVVQNVNFGVISAIAEGTEHEEMVVEIDQKVIYNIHSGVEITINGEDYLIMNQNEIFAIMEKK